MNIFEKLEETLKNTIKQENKIEENEKIKEQGINEEEIELAQKLDAIEEFSIDRFEENMAILISSHNLLELESFCTKVTIIKSGEIAETSTIEEAKKVNKESIYHLVVDKVIEVSNILENKVERIDDENIQVYAKKEEIPEIIESKERARAGKTLAAHGLYLVEVKYNKDWHKYKNIVKLINV